MAGEPGVRLIVHVLYSTAIVVAAGLLASALGSMPAQRAEVWPVAPPEAAMIIVTPEKFPLDLTRAPVRADLVEDSPCGGACDAGTATDSEAFLGGGSARTPAVSGTGGGDEPR